MIQRYTIASLGSVHQHGHQLDLMLVIQLKKQPELSILKVLERHLGLPIIYIRLFEFISFIEETHKSSKE